MDLELIFALCTLLVMVIWNVYLLQQVQTLMNKLMSRNYAEYAMAEKIKTSQPDIEEPLVDDPFEKQRAREINSMLGMG